MSYWTLEDGTISRAESRNADTIPRGETVFAAAFSSNNIVGRNLFQYIEGMDVSHLYQSLTTRVLNSGRPVSFAYRCDSPRVRREMTMRLSKDAGMVRYDSAVVRETWRDGEIPAGTAGAHAFVAMCSFCKKYRFPIATARWKELECLLNERDLPDKFRFTHGICEECYLRVIAG